MGIPLDAFYSSLASTTAAALPVGKALATCGRPDLAPLADGRPLADILAAGGFPEIDVAVLRAAETAGRTESALRSLARRAREADILRRRLRAIVLTPMFVAHGAIVAPWVVQWLFARASPALLAWNLAALWIAYALVRLLLASRSGEALPVIGPIRRDVALARFCDALAGALDAALPLRRAIALAADAAGGATAARARAVTDVERPLVESLAGVLPPFSLEMLRAGEEAGSADKALAKLAQRHFDDAMHALNVVVAVLPVLLFFGVLAVFVLQMLAMGAGTIRLAAM